MYRISYRFLVPGWSAKPLVSAHDRIMGTHTPNSRVDKHRSIIGPVRLAIIEDRLNTMPRKLHDWHSAHSIYAALCRNDR